jgi:hypothetical protein
VLAILCAGYRRAAAAERRYGELRHTNASSLTEGRTNRADIARRLFTQIYLYPRETSFRRTHNRVLLAALALCAVMPASVGRAEAMLEFIQWGAEVHTQQTSRIDGDHSMT